MRIAAFVALALATAGCDSAVQVPIDLEARFAQTLDASVDALEGAHGIDVPAVYPNNDQLPPFRAFVDFSMTESVSLANNSRLKSYRDKLLDVHVDRLELVIDENDLNEPIYHVGIFVGPMTPLPAAPDTTAATAAAQATGEATAAADLELHLLGLIPAIGAGVVGTLPVEIQPDGRERLLDYLKALGLNVAARGQVEIDTLARADRPAGWLNARLVIHMTALASVTD